MEEAESFGMIGVEQHLLRLVLAQAVQPLLPVQQRLQLAQVQPVQQPLHSKH